MNRDISLSMRAVWQQHDDAAWVCLQTQMRDVGRGVAAHGWHRLLRFPTVVSGGVGKCSDAVR
eukprot:119512-Rhodomonas_salina.1